MGPQKDGKRRGAIAGSNSSAQDLLGRLGLAKGKSFVVGTERIELGALRTYLRTRVSQAVVGRTTGIPLIHFGMANNMSGAQSGVPTHVTPEMMVNAMNFLHQQQQQMQQQMQEATALGTAGYARGDIRNFFPPANPKQEPVVTKPEPVAAVPVVKKEEKQGSSSSAAAQPVLSLDQVRHLLAMQQAVSGAPSQGGSSSVGAVSMPATVPEPTGSLDQTALIEGLLKRIAELDAKVKEPKGHGAGVLSPPKADEENHRFFIVPDNLMKSGTSVICSGKKATQAVLKEGVVFEDASIGRYHCVYEAVTAFFDCHTKRYVVQIRR